MYRRVICVNVFSCSTSAKYSDKIVQYVRVASLYFVVALQLPQWNIGWQCQVKICSCVAEETKIFDRLHTEVPIYRKLLLFFNDCMTAVPCTCFLATAMASLRIAEEKGLLPSGKLSLWTGCKATCECSCVAFYGLCFYGVMVPANIAKYFHRNFFVYSRVSPKGGTRAQCPPID